MKVNFFTKNIDIITYSTLVFITMMNRYSKIILMSYCKNLTFIKHMLRTLIFLQSVAPIKCTIRSKEINFNKGLVKISKYFFKPFSKYKL